MFRVLSSVLTCIKCRLSSSLFFFDSRLLFNESSTSTALWTLEEYVRSWIFCVLWTLNALIGMLDDKTNSEKRLLWQTQHVWLTNVKTDQGYQFYLPWRPRHTQNPTSYVFLQCSKFAVKLSLKSKRESEKKRELGNRHLMHVLTLLNTMNIQAHRRVQTVVNREASKPWKNPVSLLF